MRKTERKTRDAGTQTIDTSERCSIAVVYTDQPSRERAIGICDSLADRFDEDLQLEFTWWNTKYLQDSDVAELAADAVAKSDLVIFAASDTATLAPEVKSCLERGMRQDEGEGRERAFAAYLNTTGRKPAQSASSLDSYLRDVARRARMDYLTLNPTDASTDQAWQMRASGSAPSHWGINE